MRSRRRRRLQQPRQIAQAGRPALLRIEFETDLQVAAVHVELGTPMLLQKLNQLPQILNVLLLHSFLQSPRPSTKAANRCSLKFNQRLRRRSQHLPTAARYSHHILNANAELARQINSRLNRDHHARLQPRRLSSANPRRLMNLQVPRRGRWSAKMPQPNLPCAKRSARPRPPPRNSRRQPRHLPHSPALPAPLRRFFAPPGFGLPRKTVRVISEQ